MKPADPNDPLSRALADWKVHAKSDPHFRPSVWQRIREDSRETWASYVRARVVGWSVTAGLAVAIAGWAGHSAAKAKLDASRDEMVVSYLGKLDPRVMAKLRP